MLQTLVESPKYDSRNYTDVPYLDAVAVMDENRVTIFALNRDLDEDMEITCDLRQFDGYHVARHMVLSHDDLEAVNTEANPNNVAPTDDGNAAFRDGILTAVLGKKSWNVMVLEK